MSLTGPVPRAAAEHVTRDAGILGTDLIDTEAQPDMKRMRAYRLGRVREQLRTHDLAGIVLFDPINIRYATGSRNMSVWTLHNAARYCFIATEGPVVLFEYGKRLPSRGEARDRRRAAPRGLVVLLRGRRRVCQPRPQVGGGDRGAGPGPRRRQHEARRRPLRLPRGGRAAQPRGGDGRRPEADGGRARDQVERRDPVHAVGHRGVRGGDGAHARCACAAA